MSRTLYLLRPQPGLCRQLCRAGLGASAVASDDGSRYHCAARGARSIVNLFAQYGLEPSDLRRLSGLLGVNPSAGGHAGGRQLVNVLASEIDRRRYCLIEQRGHARAHRPVEREPAEPASRGETVTPAQLRQPQPASAPAAAPVAAEPEIDQNQQAAALVAAAREGTPFCEECEAARNASVAS